MNQITETKPPPRLGERISSLIYISFNSPAPVCPVSLLLNCRWLVRNQWVKWSFFGNTSALTIVRWLGEDEWMKEHFQWNLFNDFKLESLTREYIVVVSDYFSIQLSIHLSINHLFINPSIYQFIFCLGCLDMFHAGHIEILENVTEKTKM